MSWQLVCVEEFVLLILESYGKKVLVYRINREKYTAERNLFLKSDATDPFSILVVNLPSHFTKESLQTVFEKILCCRVKNIAIRSIAPNKSVTEGYHAMSVTLQTEYDVMDVLRRCQSISPFYLSDYGIRPSNCGLSKWCEDYRNEYIPTEELQRREKKWAKKMKNVPDADGWITVMRSHHKTVPNAIIAKNKEDISRLSKKKKSIVGTEELRKKFEMDKKKLALAKAARKFRPD
ncbi:unnamed protein product [Dracunculus medinensis]|uniref:RRP7 domain-containing protein n=1 Tax=Dracunculus medinensis TaxID=318479 RepID=A0A0N4UF81_DRAME|nr:unnamed protein product [Dracunculus medinensis]